MSAGNIGTISRISGPVVDVQFPENSSVPDIFHAVEVTIQGDVHVLECLQQLGKGAVRCISMRPSAPMKRISASGRNSRMALAIDTAGKM